MFTAVLPPEEVVAELDSLLEARRAAEPELRWTRPEGWHLTTAFMPDVSERSLPALEENLAELAAHTPPFSVGLSGGVAFPHPVKARILAMAVGEGHDQLAALSAACRSAASRAGAVPDGARFVGHLTLARHNRGLHATRWLSVLDSFPEWVWKVEELCLVESRRLGRHYEVVGRYRLGEPVSDVLD